MIIYISGRITGNDNFDSDFASAEKAMNLLDHIVLNPTCLPEGLSYDQYMDIDMAMVRACDAMLLLPRWEDGKGSRAERAYAECLGKEILYYAIKQ